MNACSDAYSKPGLSINTMKAPPATVAKASRKALGPGASALTTAVMRMCTARRDAITAPSMASHRNRADASSSLQTSGDWNTKRASTPTSRMAISIATSAPATVSTMLASTVPMIAGQRHAAPMLVPALASVGLT